MGSTCSTNAGDEEVGHPEVKKPLGRPRRRRVDNIKMDLRNIGWDGIDWIDLAEDRGQCWAVVNLSSCITGGPSRRAYLHKVS
jgi:hypothetical protein